MTTPGQDEKLRDLERRFRQTGSPDDEAAWLLERVRVGDLTQEMLEHLREAEQRFRDTGSVEDRAHYDKERARAGVPPSVSLPAFVGETLARRNAASAKSFLLFSRDWWGGRTRDVVLLWLEGRDARVYSEACGERFDNAPPKVLQDTAKPRPWYEGFLMRAVSLGVLSRRSQELPQAITHHDDYFGVRTLDGRVNFFVVPGGRHDMDPDMKLYQLFLEAVPTLAAFYKRSRPRRK